MNCAGRKIWFSIRTTAPGGRRRPAGPPREPDRVAGRADGEERAPPQRTERLEALAAGDRGGAACGSLACSSREAQRPRLACVRVPLTAEAGGDSSLAPNGWGRPDHAAELRPHLPGHGARAPSPTRARAPRSGARPERPPR